MPPRLALLVLFGGNPQIFGFVFLLFSLVLGAGFASSSEPIISRSYDRETPGVITRVEDSGSAEGDNTIYEIDATFTDESGVDRDVRSYSPSRPSLASPVTVRYQHARPDRAVIRGMRTHEFESWLVIFPLIFVGAGVWCLVSDIGERRRALRLMRMGHVARSSIVEVREEGDSEGSVWIGTFEFTTVDGRTQRCEATTLKKDDFMVGASEPVVYDAAWPDHATPFRHLAGAPTIADDGTVTYGAHPMRLVVVMALMAATAITASAAAAITLASWL